MICKFQVVGKMKDSGLLYIHPCGQCLNCRINDTRSWFVRSHMETKYSDRPFQYFLTLTYAPEFYPDDGLCVKKHLKSFLNTLNTALSLKLRYFATTDYGNVSGRAHYHAILLSMRKLSTKKIEKYWSKGFVKLQPLTKSRIKYCLRYTVKKKPFDGSLDGWFRLISKGWGKAFLDHYTGQKSLIIDGKTYAIPRYYADKLFLERKSIDKTIYFDMLYMHYKDWMQGENASLDDLKKIFFERKRYNVEYLS